MDFMLHQPINKSFLKCFRCFYLTHQMNFSNDSNFFPDNFYHRAHVIAHRTRMSNFIDASLETKEIISSKSEIMIVGERN